ncbi:hypothetical protein ADUPG1_009209 [Aduncisulcus paluster]|uniref:Uncharacterized protein n=1 Tax=Aduncisulcus paluster TaxID=2918883 RepID=A0ABQ5KUU0_9EUKA|nr:hypothetical protein ADUPG1_009209 [Aduncisulcus paluster]
MNVRRVFIFSFCVTIIIAVIFFIVGTVELIKSVNQYADWDKWNDQKQSFLEYALTHSPTPTPTEDEQFSSIFTLQSAELHLQPLVGYSDSPVVVNSYSPNNLKLSQSCWDIFDSNDHYWMQQAGIDVISQSFSYFSFDVADDLDFDYEYHSTFVGNEGINGEIFNVVDPDNPIGVEALTDFVFFSSKDKYKQQQCDTSTSGDAVQCDDSCVSWTSQSHYNIAVSPIDTDGNFLLAETMIDFTQILNQIPNSYIYVEDPISDVYDYSDNHFCGELYTLPFSFISFDVYDSRSVCAQYLIRFGVTGFSAVEPQVDRYVTCTVMYLCCIVFVALVVVLIVLYKKGLLKRKKWHDIDESDPNTQVSHLLLGEHLTSEISDPATDPLISSSIRDGARAAMITPINPLDMNLFDL